MILNTMPLICLSCISYYLFLLFSRSGKVLKSLSIVTKYQILKVSNVLQSRNSIFKNVHHLFLPKITFFSIDRFSFLLPLLFFYNLKLIQ